MFELQMIKTLQFTGIRNGKGGIRNGRRRLMYSGVREGI
jgi:hypothetical protein